MYIYVYIEFTGGQQICWCDLNLECHHRHYYRNNRRPQPTKIAASIRAAVDDYCLPSSFLIWLPSFWPSYLVRNLLEPQEKVVNIHWPGLKHMIWKIVVKNSKHSLLVVVLAKNKPKKTKPREKLRFESMEKYEDMDFGSSLLAIIFLILQLQTQTTLTERAYLLVKSSGRYHNTHNTSIYGRCVYITLMFWCVWS